MFEHVSRRRPALYVGLVTVFLWLATVACSFNSPTTLNDGKGTSDEPVPVQTYARTSDYDVRALSVVRPVEELSLPPESDMEYMRVQFQVRCTQGSDEVCDLTELRQDIKLVDNNGVIYEPQLNVGVDNPLEGQILGDAEKAGWLVYAVPQGLEVHRALTEYGQDQRVFFLIPAMAG